MNTRWRIKMEQKADNKKKVVKVMIWAVVILALLGTMHILVNYFDLFTLLQKMHGG
jgi:formate/nitrite transporter FocA (FNT family)